MVRLTPVKTLNFGRYKDVVISDQGEFADRQTRRILRTELINNSRNPDAFVKATLMLQKRHSKTQEWQDVDSFDGAHLKSGQEVRMILSSSQTLSVYEELKRLYKQDAFHQHEAVIVLQDDHLVLSERARDVIIQLLEYDDARLWEALDHLSPGIIDDIVHYGILQKQKQAVEQFEEQLAKDNWDEREWGKFFQDHQWIFGHNLSYRFLDLYEEQANLAGAGFDNTGTNLLDFLMITESDASFLVLVEIKKPNSALLAPRPYRPPNIYRPGTELVGGVSQLQSYCHTLTHQAANYGTNARELAKRGIYAFEPKAILVIGSTSQFDDDINRVSSFELFRRGLHNPEIITYDELLARAKHMVNLSTQESV